MSAQSDGPSGPEVLNGGCHLEVRQKDGAVKRVFVRVLSLRDTQRYLPLTPGQPVIADDLCQSAELFAGQKPGWADTVTTESVYAVVAEGERLNRDPLGKYVLFQQKRKKGFDGFAAALPKEPTATVETALPGSSLESASVPV